jgi:hypothetical protein
MLHSVQRDYENKTIRHRWKRQIRWPDYLYKQFHPLAPQPKVAYSLRAHLRTIGLRQWELRQLGLE